MRFWFRVGEPSWLSGSWAYALDYWSCWIGWDCPRPEMSLLRIADFMFRLFSHHQRAQWGWGGWVQWPYCRQKTASPEQSQALSLLHTELWYLPRSLLWVSCHLPFSPCPECDFQPQTSVCVDCCSCVYSLVGFLYMNMGWQKILIPSISRAWTNHIIGVCCFMCWLGWEIFIIGLA